MKTLNDLLALSDRISLPEGWMKCWGHLGDGYYFQILMWAPDSNDPNETGLQSCRKWYVSKWSTDTEVVRTVHKAGMAAIEHEFNEQFKFDGVAIANPHLSCAEMAKAQLPSDSRK